MAILDLKVARDQIKKNLAKFTKIKTKIPAIDTLTNLLVIVEQNIAQLETAVLQNEVTKGLKSGQELLLIIQREIRTGLDQFQDAKEETDEHANAVRQVLAQTAQTNVDEAAEKELADLLNEDSTLLDLKLPTTAAPTERKERADGLLAN